MSFGAEIAAECARQMGCYVIVAALIFVAGVIGFGVIGIATTRAAAMDGEKQMPCPHRILASLKAMDIDVSRFDVKLLAAAIADSKWQLDSTWIGAIKSHVKIATPCPPDADDTRCGLFHLGFAGIIETDEQLARLAEDGKQKDSLARSGMFSTNLKVSPIDTVARRVTNGRDSDERLD